MKIMSMPVDKGGCGQYRTRQPFEFIKKYTPHDVHIIDVHKDDMMQIVEALKNTNVAVMRQGAEEILNFIENYKDYFSHLKWVLDIDDNVEVVNPYSEHYLELGTEEVIHRDKDGKEMFLWKDGQGGFDLERNRKRIASLIEGMKKADMVTTTTQTLADYAKQYNNNVKVLPNCINYDRWWKLPLKKNKKLRVVWSGGISHYEDWYTIKEPLNELMRKYDFTLVMIGAKFKGIVDEDNQKNLEIHDWIDFKGHSYRMMCMNADIAVIPLKDMPFNHCKSSIKYYEMSAMGVPSVVANILPYSEDINEKNAFPYSTADEFKKQLELAIKDEKLRHSVANEAMKYTKDNFDLKKNIHLWVDAYSSLL